MPPPAHRLAKDFLPTFMYCMGSGNFDVVQTALRNLPEYVLLCQGRADAPSGHVHQTHSKRAYALGKNNCLNCYKMFGFNFKYNIPAGIPWIAVSIVKSNFIYVGFFFCCAKQH